MAEIQRYDLLQYTLYSETNLNVRVTWGTTLVFIHNCRNVRL